VHQYGRIRQLAAPGESLRAKIVSASGIPEYVE
jgi:hypothetical protein